MTIFRINLVVLMTIFLMSCENKNGNSSTNLSKNDSTLQVIEETVSINGVNHYIVKMGNGEPILVLHSGPGLFHNYLTSSFEKLAADYQIIFYDQRGCGKTDFPSDTSSINLNQYVEDLEVIRNYLKIDKLNLAGHSFGAVLAINYGKKYPDRLKKLILISPAPATSEFFDQMFKNMESKRSEEDIKKMVKTMGSKDFDNRKPETILEAIKIEEKVNLADQTKVDELYKDMIFSEKTANNMLIVNSIMEKNFFNYNITEGMNLITCPTLIILGDLDNVPFASSQLLQENLPNSRLEVLKHSAHYPFFEAQKEFNTIVKDFLNPEYE